MNLPRVHDKPRYRRVYGNRLLDVYIVAPGFLTFPLSPFRRLGSVCALSCPLSPSLLMTMLRLLAPMFCVHTHRSRQPEGDGDHN